MKEDKKIKLPEINERKEDFFTEEKDINSSKEDFVLKSSSPKTGKKISNIEKVSLGTNKISENISNTYKKEEKISKPFSKIDLSERKSGAELSKTDLKEKKNSPTFSPLKIEGSKSNIKLEGNLSERKGQSFISNIDKLIQKEQKKISYTDLKNKKTVSIEYNYQRVGKNSPAFSPLKIEKGKNDYDISSTFELKQKTSIDIVNENPMLGKETGEDLLLSPAIISKQGPDVMPGILTQKDSPTISYNPDFIQKEEEELRTELSENKSGAEINNDVELSTKNGSLINTEVETVNKKDADLSLPENLSDKEDYNLVNDFLMSNKKDFGITGELSEEQKKTVNLIVPKITEGKKDKIAKEKVNGFFKLVSNVMSEISEGMEGDLARVLLMPYETDSLISSVKAVGNNASKGTLGGAVSAVAGAAGVVSDTFSNLKYFSAGELVALYTADFYTLQGSKPSPTVKSPEQAVPFIDNSYSGQILINEDDPFGSIESGVTGILGKISSYTNISGLKSYAVNQVKNLIVSGINKLTGSIFGSSNNSNIKIAIIKDNFKVSLDPTVDNTKESEEEKTYIFSLKDGNVALKLSDINDYYASDSAVKEKFKQDNAIYVDGTYEINQKNGKEEKPHSYTYNLGTDKNGNNIKATIQANRAEKLKENNAIKFTVTEGDADNPFEISANDDYFKDNVNEVNRKISLNYQSVKARNDYNLGYMLIEPADYTTNFSTFKVDFQFNPTIDENSMSARYNSDSVLNRIGNIETYVGTDSIKIGLGLKYRVLSDNDVEGSNWMAKWTLSYIQQIEMALRSLTVPIVYGSRSTRPPIIRVEMGAYSNLFKFPILKNQSQRWRFFVAGDVKINKFYDGSSYYLDGIGRDNGNLYARDTMGFDADISLVEVKKSYFTTYPNFNDYYNSVTQNSAQGSLKYFEVPKGI